MDPGHLERRTNIEPYLHPNPYPVEIPQRQPLAYVTEVTTAEIQGEQELLFNSVAPDVVEVAVRQVRVVEVAEDESHPLLSLHGDGLNPDQQGDMSSLLRKCFQATVRIFAALVL